VDQQVSLDRDAAARERVQVAGRVVLPADLSGLHVEGIDVGPVEVVHPGGKARHAVHARIAELRDLQIQAPWSPLNRLKGGNAQAFHYWYQAQHILTMRAD
jgi:hypothetical protein